MNSFPTDHVKGTIEAILFVSEKPISLDQLKEVLPTVSGAEIKETAEALKKEYDDRRAGFVIVAIAGGYQMLSSSHYALEIRNFYKTRHKEKLSKPALETLAIMAYKQPVARIDVEMIRGVNSDGVVSHLLEKGLIKIVGRKDVPGRPFLYGTTKQFLEYFGLRALEDLPKLEDFPALAAETKILPIEETSDQTTNTTAIDNSSANVEVTEEISVEETAVVSASETETSKTDASLTEISVEQTTIIKEEVTVFLKEAAEFNAPENIVQEIEPAQQNSGISVETKTKRSKKLKEAIEEVAQEENLT